MSHEVPPLAHVDTHKMIVANTGDDDLGFYFLGHNFENDDLNEGTIWDGSETLNAIIAPGEEAGRFVSFGDAFVFRSADMRWRVRVHVHPHTDDRQPYKVSFYNLMTEENGEDVELKHHDEGYLWIE